MCVGEWLLSKMTEEINPYDTSLLLKALRLQVQWGRIYMKINKCSFRYCFKKKKDIVFLFIYSYDANVLPLSFDIYLENLILNTIKWTGITTLRRKDI